MYLNSHRSQNFFWRIIPCTGDTSPLDVSLGNALILVGTCVAMYLDQSLALATPPTGSKYVTNLHASFDANHRPGTKLYRLLKFYDVQQLRVPRATGFDPNSDDEQPNDEEELSAVEGIIRDQTACLEELALRLGLDFERIQREIERMERFKQQFWLLAVVAGAERISNAFHNAETPTSQGPAHLLHTPCHAPLAFLFGE